jgi:succinate dehydrogenase/fumarate reductase flavoprotein subunit
MENRKRTLNDYLLDCYSVNTLIIGSGAASLNAAISLHSMGQKDILIATAAWGGGTTNNAGSDKQTYYKLSLSGEEPDSFIKMAGDLFNGKCMHGDIALCEAQGSVQAFMNLVRLGVPFPQNRYGAWVGYKTDNDPQSRATSAGPLTSKLMFKVLSREARRLKIKILDRIQVISLLTGTGESHKKVIGALAINLKEKDPKKAFILFNSVNIVLGTGGPGGIYEWSAYPHSQTGYAGMAYEAGATGQNLTESQFGIASTKLRWNLSGSYQQAIPRYFSTDINGSDEKEFLNDFFPDIKTLTKAIFLKGYQWPFDPGRIRNYGSSLIDLLVFREITEMNRRVYIDYLRNPSGKGTEKFTLRNLDKEVYDFLKNSGALENTPLKRLEAINAPAVQLYLDNKIDLRNEPLEIGVSAQHNNGGLKGNIWWESDLKHLFPVGEVNGSHGVRRPGGSALNSGQVGSYRAALFIQKKYSDKPVDFELFIRKAKVQVEKRLKLADTWGSSGARINFSELFSTIRCRMSETAGIIRDKRKTDIAVEEALSMMKYLPAKLSVSTVKELALGFLLVDQCITHYIYLEAVKFYLDSDGRSRGSYLVTDPKGILPVRVLESKWRYSLCRYDRDIESDIIEISFKNSRTEKSLIKVREIPPQEYWFERVWKKNLEDNLTEC